jgi:tetratricopeptide (TPR) repeat protein
MSGPSVELSMIVKDGAASLKRCLASVAPLVDRIVLGDTGSTDDTVAIARAFGAEIVSVPWQNDFSHARNCLLQHSRCDWILVLDADEMLDATAIPLLPQALARPGIFAYDLWRWNYVRTTSSRSGDEGALANPLLVDCSRPYPAFVRSRNTRLFRRHPGIFFERPVHENVAESVQALGLTRSLAPFVIHHFGQVEDSPQTRFRKNNLYAQIGARHLRSNPADPRTHFELGLVQLEHHRSPERALPHFNQAVQRNPRSAEAWLFAGVCHLRLNRFEAALKALTQSEQLVPNSIVLHESLGDAHFHRQDYPRAAQSYARAHALGGTSALIEAKRGACEVHLGQTIQGLERVERALQRDPTFAELYDVASATALLAGNLPLATRIAVKRTALARTTAFHFTFAAALSESTGAPNHARSLLQQGLAHFPADTALQQAILECPLDPTPPC